MIEYLFLDLDDTILDFQKAEYFALRKTLAFYGIVPTDAVCDLYHAINKAHWEMLERKEITRDQVQFGRFHKLFEALGRDADAAQVNATYMQNLGTGHYFLPGAEEAVAALSSKYKLYLASNGTASVQAGRLKSANISRYFADIFISEDMGANKPAQEYFDACFARIPGFARERAMIVGDSLTSDILGGIRAGIATCWVNPSHQPGREDIHPDYEIESLAQLDDLLKSL